jgi:hypothetical protein
MKKMGYFDECRFCKPSKPRFYGDGWFSTGRARLAGIVEDTDGGSVPLDGELYLSGNENGTAVLAHFRPTKIEGGALAGIDGAIAVVPTFEYCPYCGRRLDNA